jgi:OPA family glycerol-3-phosphate transporter-like MFS transporter/OPA family sugar phosphate sensor protein UhpC-like MFS transporter
MSVIAPQPPATAPPPLDYEPAALDPRYRHYRPRIMLWTIVGYAMFYFVRKNLAVAMPAIEAQQHITKANLGLFLTLHGLLYGVSKFANGMIGDRVNARYFMAAGLLLSAAMNVFFGLSSTAVMLGVFWMLNGWFQGIGFPPCARLMTHWFHPRELATKMSQWNISHGLGAGAVAILCGYLVHHYNNWRLCFFVPAALAIVTSLLLLIFLRDTPESVGLPPVEGTGGAEGGKSDADPANGAPDPNFRATLVEKVFSNPYIWMLGVANFFVYTVRYALLDWGPTMLKEYRHVDLQSAGWMLAGFEAAGLAGMLAAGWITDRVFGGRGARTCVFCMIACAATVLLFWRTPVEQRTLGAIFFMASGAFIYGPQALVGIAAANLATKKAAATAVGLTGLFGYGSTILSGWGLGLLVQTYGWNRAFGVLLVAAVVGVVLFLLAWKAPRDGYATNKADFREA